jgi:hypothetical protein
MSQFTLKIIALLAMLLDHTAKVLLKSGTLSPYVGLELETLIRMTMMVLGRMAFPIFAWCTAVGCQHSKNPKKYLLRMLLFAILSEIPFQLCFRSGLSLGCHNVIFTLLLAAAAIYGGAFLEDKIPCGKAIAAAAAVVLAWILQTDYNAWGVSLVLLLYYMPTEPGKLIALAAWVTLFQLIWHGWNGQTLSWLSRSGSAALLYWLGGMLSVGLIAANNGQQGRRVKWLFYLFYPIHLLALYALAQALL